MGLGGGLWFFVPFRNFFSDNTRVRMFFFKNLTVGYMTKTLNQNIIFFFHQNQNIFFSNVGNQNIFLEKKPHNPPLLLKLNGCSLTNSQFDKVKIQYFSEFPVTKNFPKHIQILVPYKFLIYSSFVLLSSLYSSLFQ